MNIPNQRLQWRPTNAPEAVSRFDDIWFVDPDTGWAVNSSGHVLFTEDGGASWRRQFDSPAYLRCIGFANRNLGWIGSTTSAQRLYRTGDGGETWEVVDNLPTFSPSAICGLSVVTEKVVFASGTNYPNRPARIIKTLDGGATWTGLDMEPYAALLVDIHFVSERVGWVVGGRSDVANPDRRDVKAVVLYTDDGGATWTNRLADIDTELPLGEWGWKIQFLDDRIGFISLENFTAGAILRTTDGGMTWERKPLNDAQGNANLEGIGFLDGRRGWVGGWGTADFSGGFSSATEDGGDNWRDANEIGRFINRFRFFSNPVKIGYASGLGVYKYSAEPVPPLGPAALAGASTGLLQDASPLDVEGPVKLHIRVPSGARRLRVDVWDRFASHVRSPVDVEDPAPGSIVVPWDRRTEAGEEVEPGIFIYRVTVDDNAESGLLRLHDSAP